MKWTSEKITELRLQLGWSVADFARRFGVKSETVSGWESGEKSPTPDDCRQLEFLSFQNLNYNESLRAQAQAEALISENNYEQIYREKTLSR